MTPATVGKVSPAPSYNPKLFPPPRGELKQGKANSNLIIEKAISPLQTQTCTLPKPKFRRIRKM